MRSRALAGAATQALTTSEIAWLAAVPTTIVVVLAIALLGPPLGNALLPTQPGRFWANWEIGVHPEPVEHARFLIALGAPLLLSVLMAAALRRRPRLPAQTIDPLILAVQLLTIAFVVICVLAQRELLGPLYSSDGPKPLLYDFFTLPTLVAAAIGSAGLIWAARSSRLRAAATRASHETPGLTVAAGLAVVVLLVVWLSHAIYTEATIGAAFRDVVYHVQFPLDETYAVLNGRSPLVDFAAQYGSLWPYAYATAMSLLSDSTGMWLGLAVATTGLGMLAIYAVLRRVTRSSVYGLLLFAPVLAASFYRVNGTLDARYTYGDYYGTFPLRYAGPSLLAWLVVRHLAGAQPRRSWPLFLAAGLVTFNNADAGLPALSATVAALLWAGGRPTRASLGRLALALAGGLAAAFALVSALTLVRAGALPDLALLVRFARLFGSAGFAMVPMPTLGLHLVVYLTFVAAIGVATVRALDAERDRLLTGMLAWSGVFGLGAGAYFAGRSTPENLIAMFFPWTFALALLLVPALESVRTMGRPRPPLAAVACMFGFLALACTLAQTPAPWRQIDRLQQRSAAVFAPPWGQSFVAAHTHRGERAAILLLLGHRIGANLGVVNVSPYSAISVMPTAEQLNEAITALRESGGDKLFLVADTTGDDMELALERAGFVLEVEDPQTHTTLWRNRRGTPRR